MSSGYAYVAPASGELGTFTKAQLDTAISDGNAVYVGDALNGTLGATTPASAVVTTITESANAATGTGGLVRATSPTLVTPALGTPSSGVVTNLTGTASININGTVGATTPASVAATTGSFSGVITATSTGTHAFGTTNTVTIANGLLTATASSSIVAAITVGATGSGNTFSLFANAGAGAAGIKTDGFKNFDFRNCTTVTFTNIAPEGILSFTTVGKSITYKSGTGQRAGNATLVAGTVTVTNTSITANSVIIPSRKTAGGTVGDLTYTTSAGASFTINSANILDTSVVSYLIQEVV